MTFIEKMIFDNKAKIELIEEIINKDSWEMDNGFWRAVLQGKLDAMKTTLEIFEKE